MTSFAVQSAHGLHEFRAHVSLSSVHRLTAVLTQPCRPRSRLANSIIREFGPACSPSARRSCRLRTTLQPIWADGIVPRWNVHWGTRTTVIDRVTQPRERMLACRYLHDWYVGRPRETVSLTFLHSALPPRTPVVSTFSSCLCGWVRDGSTTC